MADSELPSLPPRSADAHKGHFGNALLIGGSRGMSGAIAMAGMAALRTGAGLCRLAVPECCVDTVAGFSPCAMIIPISRQDCSGRIAGITQELKDWLGKSSCVAIGPGIGRSPHLNIFLSDVLQFLAENAPSVTVVIDADGLNALAGLHHDSTQWTQILCNPTVLTPHPGEWARLSGIAATDVDEQSHAAVVLARQANCTIVLKGHRSLVTNGEKSMRNETGTPAMATGGSGDVLTGVITALICQGLSPFDAAHLGTHIHGLAGQIAEHELGSHVVLPTELIQFLPKALRNQQAQIPTS